VESFIGDVRDIRSVERVFEKYPINLVYHAAAMKHVVVSENFPMECALTNIQGTQNIVDLAKKYKVPKLITISTDKSTSPSNVMGATKLIAEKITINADYTCVRFGNVANSRGSVIPVLIENLKNKKPIIVTDREVTRFMIRIPDAVKLVVNATKHAQGGDIFILKMKAFKLGDLIDVLVQDIVPLLKISKNDVKIINTGLTIGEKNHEDLINPTEINRVFEIDNMYVVLSEKTNFSKYNGIKTTNLQKYSSNDSESIPREEIKKIVSEYLGAI
jgi:FlaA1/EpsC-like NDP-sugar epimerase